MHTYLLFTTIMFALPGILPTVMGLSSLFLLSGYAAQIKFSVKKVIICAFVICALTIVCFIFNPMIINTSLDSICGLLSELLFIFNAAIALFIIFVSPRFILAHPVIFNVVFSIQIMSTVFCFWSIGFISELVLKNFHPSFFYSMPDTLWGVILHKIYTSFIYSAPSLVIISLFFLFSVLILNFLTKHTGLISKIFGFLLILYYPTIFLSM